MILGCAALTVGIAGLVKDAIRYNPGEEAEREWAKLRDPSRRGGMEDLDFSMVCVDVVGLPHGARAATVIVIGALLVGVSSRVRRCHQADRPEGDGATFGPSSSRGRP